LLKDYRVPGLDGLGRLDRKDWRLSAPAGAEVRGAQRVAEPFGPRRSPRPEQPET